MRNNNNGRRKIVSLGGFNFIVLSKKMIFRTQSGPTQTKFEIYVVLANYPEILDFSDDCQASPIVLISSFFARYPSFA